MKMMIEILKKIGISDDELQRVIDCYRDDSDGFKQYFLYMRAMFDDREQYI